MSQFYYYIPNTKGVELEDLAALGIGYAFEAKPAKREVNSGPCNKGPGIVIAATEEDIGYFPELQAWREIPGTSVCVGYYTDKMPSPESLKREVHPAAYFAGYDRFDNAWTAASVLGEDKAITLPKSYDIDSEGKVIETHQRRYDDLLKAALYCYDVTKDGGTMSLDDRVKHAVLGVSAIYRVGITECVELGLLNESNVNSIVCAMTGYQILWGTEE